MGRVFEENKYSQVTSCCGLNPDFEQLSNNDLTKIGDTDGIQLSGGQKQRLNIARCVYSDADIYLLDDPLSALDSQVSNFILDECFCKYLKDKTRIVSSNNLYNLHKYDYVIVLQDGRLIEYDHVSNLKSSVFKSMYTPKESIGSLTKAKVKKKSIKFNSIRTFTNSKKNKAFEHKTNPIDILKHYLISQKKYGDIIWNIVFNLLYIGFQIGSIRFISAWSSDQYKMDRTFYIVTWSLLIVGQIISTYFQSFFFSKFCFSRSIVLFNKLLSKLFSASIVWLETNSAGDIIQTLSFEQSVIDSSLVEKIKVLIYFLLQAVSNTILMIIFAPWLSIIIPMILIAFLKVCIFYLKSNMMINNWDLISRGKVVRYFNECIINLPIIQINEQQLYFFKKGVSIIQHHGRSSIYYHLSNRWFQSVLESLSNILNFAIILILCFSKNNNSAGLALSFSSTLSTCFAIGIFKFLELIQALKSVECNLQLTQKIQVEKLDSYNTESQWPAKGDITIQNLYFKYSDQSPYVLKDINARIDDKEKIGICGRTGSGKSSLISLLFRIGKPYSGDIMIDSLSIFEIPVSTVRHKLSIIPQEPFIFKGSIKNNIDPLFIYDEKRILEVVTKIGLDSSLSSKSFDLDLIVSNDTLSTSQKAQISAARALLKNSKLLVMDEATASLDDATEMNVQTAVLANSNCTVLAIAHKLKTIVKFDKILVLDFGHIVEFDSPQNLISCPTGSFYNLVMQSENRNILIDMIMDNCKK